ncbi:EAL domain-containing protein [Rugamonas sp. A1-17]|nr:EAL domain-containing protein [Rugamonas sp. A1-17]
MQNPNINSRVSIDVDDAQVGQVQFELQPIVRTNCLVARGFELLFRGPSTMDWIDVDRAALNYVRAHKLDHTTLFVNLANESLMSIPTDEFVSTAGGRKVVFEISESHSEHMPYSQIADKVNELIELGFHFAIDDFGSGRDGLKRIYSIKRASVIKIDRLFVRQSMSRSDAANVLRLLVAQWKASGIQVVMEGVENAAILDFAKDIGADLVQGWHVDTIIADRVMQAA